VSLYLKGWKKNGGWVDFSKNIRASLFNKCLSNEPCIQPDPSNWTVTLTSKAISKVRGPTHFPLIFLTDNDSTRTHIFTKNLFLPVYPADIQ
jgi:hypothetical protein